MYMYLPRDGLSRPADSAFRLLPPAFVSLAAGLPGDMTGNRGEGQTFIGLVPKALQAGRFAKCILRTQPRASRTRAHQHTLGSSAGQSLGLTASPARRTRRFRSCAETRHGRSGGARAQAHAQRTGESAPADACSPARGASLGSHCSCKSKLCTGALARRTHAARAPPRRSALVARGGRAHQAVQLVVSATSPSHLVKGASRPSSGPGRASPSWPLRSAAAGAGGAAASASSWCPPCDACGASGSTSGCPAERPAFASMPPPLGHIVVCGAAARERKREFRCSWR